MTVDVGQGVAGTGSLDPQQTYLLVQTLNL